MSGDSARGNDQVKTERSSDEEEEPKGKRQRENSEEEAERREHEEELERLRRENEKLKREEAKKQKREEEKLKRENEKLKRENEKQKREEAERLKREEEERLRRENERLKREEVESLRRENERLKREEERLRRENERLKREEEERLRRENERLKREEERRREEILRTFKVIEEFIRLFKEEKPLIEGHLRELKRIADRLDKVNKQATIAKTAGSSLCAIGGTMAFAGLVLAPFTLGATATGVYTAVAGGATNLTTEIVKASSVRDYNRRVQQECDILQSKMSALGESYKDACGAVSEIDEAHIGVVLKNACLTRMRLGAVELLADAASLISKGAKRFGALDGVFLLWNVFDIVSNFTAIQHGFKSVRAEEIRKLVESVESDLAALEAVSSEMDSVLKDQ
ncbi:apolipoprotein L3-like isoform X1 [Acipenser oxyrinchus oxyrinchus]|uniref:Apolipoprotein L3-like isoform X1 n=1 Tax=Acipenser oxyrinchus oxyrinchus TaxID=40147 RepID=A0AAD8CR04_ACIOX|nr:apolipoprotein L3-like isoform X1 [Acipenser oxyrinchus oxyrinchus]